MNILLIKSFVDEIDKIANIRGLRFGPAPVEKTVARVSEATRAVPSLVARKTKKKGGVPKPHDWDRIQQAFRDANKRRLGSRWREGMTSRQAAIEAVPQQKVQPLRKSAAAVDWVAPIAGSLIGGDIAVRGSNRFLKGRYMAPLTIAGSLGGSIAAGEMYRKHRRKKLRKRLKAREAYYRKKQ